MRILAISDLHIGYEANFKALESISARPNDWLLLGGDVCETSAQLRSALQILSKRFAKLFWVPGNHELWTTGGADRLRGVEKYNSLVEVCREFHVLTPEDPFEIVEDKSGRFCVVPMFLFYDYSFRPQTVAVENAVAWAEKHGIVCADEEILHADPFSSRQDWCAERCESTHRRLKAIPSDVKLILLNHYPLRYDLVHLPLIPQFSIWCGTKRTESWHTEFNVDLVVYGHLHMPTRVFRDGVRFEEVSLGYPRQWHQEGGIDAHVREVWSNDVASTGR